MKYLSDDFVLCQKLTLVLHCHLNCQYSCDLQNLVALEALPVPMWTIINFLDVADVSLPNMVI